MKKFTVTETRNAIYTWVFEVEAESEEKALEQVLDDPEKYIVDYTVDPDETSESEFEITEKEK